ncbi:MAG: peptide-methionine (S)-S-oxide reductase MsrA [Gammaproteobacteria bacterium]|nr:peptide-methionine (S)-S-oxide reductase MsrA [Gammaproteobacteria bacterium]
MAGRVELATFGAGCFWGVEAQFRVLNGVLDATSGYMGGQPDPRYQAVCSGTTDHAEVVQVQFDTKLVSYETLLALFFEMHNPTTLNRQGPDVGSQYRSVVFFHTAEQQEAACKTIATIDQSGKWPQAVVTEVKQAMQFWPAEEYHQRYLEKRGLSSCSI